MKVSGTHVDWIRRIGNGRKRVADAFRASTSMLLKVCVLLVSALISQSHASAADEAAGGIELGRTLYDRHCASCHGANLEGQPNWKKRMPSGRMPAPPHDVTGHTWHHPDEQIFKITKYGTKAIVGDDYKSDMLGFQNALTDDEIRAVIAFIKSTWPERVRKRQRRMKRRQAQ